MNLNEKRTEEKENTNSFFSDRTQKNIGDLKKPAQKNQNHRREVTKEEMLLFLLCAFASRSFNLKVCIKYLSRIIINWERKKNAGPHLYNNNKAMNLEDSCAGLFLFRSLQTKCILFPFQRF
jgi:uncharacterized Rmd1/YagE family protein